MTAIIPRRAVRGKENLGKGAEESRLGEKCSPVGAVADRSVLESTKRVAKLNTGAIQEALGRLGSDLKGCGDLVVAVAFELVHLKCPCDSAAEGGDGLADLVDLFAA
jgi:hypothetical protein